MAQVGGPRRVARAELITVYVVGLFQGLALVAFPAGSSQLTGPSDYDLSTSQCGLLFVPQVLMAIAASLLLLELSRRFVLKRLFLVGIAANVTSMARRAQVAPA
jgi:hypothetical protein